MPFLLIWTFLKNNYQLVILGLMVTFILGYISYINIDRKHLRHKVQELQLIINQANDKEKQLELGNMALTRKYQNALLEINTKTEKINLLLKEKIANDQELKSLRVSLHALRLFNESKRDPATIVTGTIKGNDEEANTSTTNSGSEGSVSLATVFLKVAENDKNHWDCVHQVEAWQSFWLDYKANYLGVMEGK